MERLDEKKIKEIKEMEQFMEQYRQKTEQFIDLIQQLDPVRQKGVLLVLKGATLIAKGNEEELYK